MGTDNLVSLSERTTEEQRRIASLGGVASGQARRERRQIRDALEAALDGTYTVDGIEASGLVHACIALVRKAMQGDPKAFQVIRDSIGEKPAERVEVAEISEETRARVAAALECDE